MPTGRKIAQVKLDAQAAELRAQGLTYQAIADQLGWDSRVSAFRAVDRSLKDTLGEAPAQIRQMELDRLDELWRKAYEVMARDHITVQHGKVVRRQTGVERHEDGIEKLDHDGQPIPVWEDIPDDAPILQAIDRLLRISERRAKLLGLDMPVKADVTVHQVDPADLELMQIIEAAQRRNVATEARLRGELPAGGE